VKFIYYTLLLRIIAKGTLIRLSGLSVLAEMAILFLSVVISILLELLGVTFAREFIVVDRMANSDLFQVNPIPNQYGVYLNLCNIPEMVGVNVAERPLLRLDRHISSCVYFNL
jgi:hypothetical protein